MILFKNETPSILLVEDDPEQRRLLERGLTRLGHRVAAVRDARGALARLTLEPFDVVISDLNLPGMRGDELLRTIRPLNQRIPFVMLTGENDVPTAVQAVRDGADDYLMKPATASRVQESIFVAINHRHDELEREHKMKNAEFHELRAFLSGIRSLVISLEAKDEYTKNHSKKVAQIALMMARALPGMTHRQLREIRVGAWLHDIGKIAIPLTILHKDGPLEPDEWEVVKQHTVQGARIVEPLARKYPEIQRIVRHEHERWDGKGYPDGISGNDIPLGSRLIMIADTYDAICSTRPYRKALPKEAALEVIREGAGTQFDPNLVPVFEATYQEFPHPE
ncbi:MAG: HD-GYP domain-containing protein [Planctomycetota bacterium]